MNSKKIIFLLLVLLITSMGFCKPISVKGAVFKSFLLPGWGELSVGDKTGYIFILTEIFAWSSRFYFANEEKNSENRAFNFARAHAGVKVNSYEDQFFLTIEKYSHSDFRSNGYNEMVMRKAIELYPKDKTKQQKYIDQNSYNDLYSWEWDNDVNQKEFVNIQSDINKYKDYAKVMTGAIILNHLLSGLNAYRAASKNLDFSIKMDNNMNPCLMTTYRF